VASEVARPTRDGRCQWCRQTDEGGKTVATATGYWWHLDCAEDNLNQLQEAIDRG
jgi:hypothetical protein